MPRPAHVPQKIWLAAKGVSVRFADDAAIQRMAEMLMRRQRGDDEPDQDCVNFWPGLTRRGTRIVRDALMEFETVIDDDVSELFKLRSVFNHQAPE